MTAFVTVGKEAPHNPFHGWLLMFGLMLFGMFLLWWHGLAVHLLEGDQTRISIIIILVFVATSGYLGRAAWRLSLQRSRLHAVQGQAMPVTTGENIRADDVPDSWAQEYLILTRSGEQQGRGDNDPVFARLVEQAHRGHSLGWFVSDLLVRLGLIGTVIGFVLMLGSVYQIENDDIAVLQQLLRDMGSGMRVALYTTLVGVGAGLLLSIQCQWLDRCADGLVSGIVTLSLRPFPPPGPGPGPA